MNLQTIIRENLKQRRIEKQPSVLVDIGASYGINNLWKNIASFSICLAFDADDRKFEYLEEKNSSFKKLIKVNKIVVDNPNRNRCLISIILIFFEIVEKKKMSVVELPTILKKTGIDYIDWFKTDTQGTDLRLFKSLDRSIRNKNNTTRD